MSFIKKRPICFTKHNKESNPPAVDSDDMEEEEDEHNNQVADDAELDNLANTMQCVENRLGTLNITDSTVNRMVQDAKLRIFTLRHSSSRSSICGGDGGGTLASGTLPRGQGVEVFLKYMDRLGSNNSFTWTVENMRCKLEYSKRSTAGIQRYFEGPIFYINPFGYSFQLCLHLGESIGVLMRLVKGDYDDLLEWPFNKQIKISLLSQVTKSKYPSNPTPKKCSTSKIHGDKSHTIKPKTSSEEKKDWSRPGENDNRRWVGNHAMITRKELIGVEDFFISDYLRNDRTIIRVELPE